MKTISQEEYDRLMKLQETPIAHLAHSSCHASTSSLGTALLDHTSSTQCLLTRLSKLLQPSSISIVDGHAYLIMGHGKANLTSSL